MTIITPFRRVENLEYLVKVLKGHCHWVLLTDEDIKFPDWIMTGHEWITIKRYDKRREGICKSNSLLNEYFRTVDGEEQYMVLCDDDSVEEGFFDKIPNEDAVLVSMKRGDRPTHHVEWSDYKAQMGRWVDSLDILEAKPENLRLGMVGGEQLILKGKILKNYRYGLSNVGDGEMIIKVSEENNITYVPNAFVLFNYFEDGRYESFTRNKPVRLKPVVMFIGDYFCAGQPRMGLSEWEGNIWASLESTGLAEVCRFHFDKYYYHTGQRGDEALLERIKVIQPDYIVLIIYKHLGQDQAVMTEDTLPKIKVPIITIWGDLEAQEQRDIANEVKPYVWKIIGTASKEVVEAQGYTYTHVPKDPRIFNNPNKVRDIDIVFSGSFGLGREERQKAMVHLLDNGIKLVHGGSEGRDHFTTEEYADRYKRAKLSLSFSKAHGLNVVNARPFEAMLCGSMLLEQESPELAKLYTPYIDYVPWKDEVDLLNKVRYYLENDGQREFIARNGQLKTESLYSAKIFWEQTLK